MSEAVAHSGVSHHPIGLVVTDDLQRSRLTTFFRPILAIPHLILVSLWGIAVYFALIIAWFAALFTGRVPLSLHSFMADWLRYATRVTGYVNLLANPFPQFGAGGEYPFDAHIDDGRGAEPGDRALPADPRDPRAADRVPLRERGRPRRAARLVLHPVHRAHARGHAKPRRVDERYVVQTNGYVLLLTGRYPTSPGRPPSSRTSTSPLAPGLPGVRAGSFAAQIRRLCQSPASC